MRIQDSNGLGYVMWLSARDTSEWARRPGAVWLFSDLSGNRVMVAVDRNGLYDFTLNGKDGEVSGDELSACVADHLPAKYRHLWPVWENLTAGVLAE